MFLFCSKKFNFLRIKLMTYYFTLNLGQKICFKFFSNFVIASFLYNMVVIGEFLIYNNYVNMLIILFYILFYLIIYSFLIYNVLKEEYFKLSFDMCIFESDILCLLNVFIKYF